MSNGTTEDLAGSRARRIVGVWLLSCAVLVFVMALIGAVTRLTGSGLSMVEWKPLIGVLPPLSDVEWERVFALYRATPEYALRNFGMSLAEFKEIFFWEWLHRTWGHLIGVAFVLPLAGFVLAGWVRGRLAVRLTGLLALGALQGGVGWFMVLSGLVDRPDVSHYRLALHLGLAAVLYALLIAVAARLLLPVSGASGGGWRGLRRATWGVLGLAGVTMLWGAFVAGLDAGFVYNTFPTMDGDWFPAAGDTLSPWWRNAFENTATVQFIHRWLGLTTAAAGLLLVVRIAGRVSGPPARLALALGVALLAQAGLGILTLLTRVALHPAVTHQAMAFVLIGLLVWLLRSLSEDARGAAGD